jgi:hypothetical protein
MNKCSQFELLELATFKRFLIKIHLTGVVLRDRNLLTARMFVFYSRCRHSTLIFFSDNSVCQGANFFPVPDAVVFRSNVSMLNPGQSTSLRFGE